jgi:hypothetical protein
VDQHANRQGGDAVRQNNRSGAGDRRQMAPVTPQVDDRDRLGSTDDPRVRAAAARTEHALVTRRLRPAGRRGCRRRLSVRLILHVRSDRWPKWPLSARTRNGVLLERWRAQCGMSIHYTGSRAGVQAPPRPPRIVYLKFHGNSYLFESPSIGPASPSPTHLIKETECR